MYAALYVAYPISGDTLSEADTYMHSALYVADHISGESL